MGVGVVVAQAQVAPQRVAPDDCQRVLKLIVAAVPLLASGGGAAVEQRVQLDERGEALDELRHKGVHFLVHVAAAVAHDAAVGAVVQRADTADEVALGSGRRGGTWTSWCSYELRRSQPRRARSMHGHHDNAGHDVGKRRGPHRTGAIGTAADGGHAMG